MEVIRLFERLTGQQSCLGESISEEELKNIFKEGTDIGLSQFNEILLLLGYDRVTPEFYTYLTESSDSITEVTS